MQLPTVPQVLATERTGRACRYKRVPIDCSENYCVEGFMPIVFRQDTRYYTIGRGGSLNGVSIIPTDHPHMQRGGVSPTGGWHNPMMADHEDFRVIANAGTLA